MKILIGCNYYAPYVSGVSEYVRRLAEGLANQHEVVVVTSQHEPDLPREERINGVLVIREPVWLKISKGVICPSYPAKITRLAQEADVLNLHLPMLESGIIAAFSDPQKLIVTYHCDIDLPPGLMKPLIEGPMFASMHLALRRARAIVVNTLDYSRQSETLQRYLTKCHEISPPITMPQAEEPLPPSGPPTIGFLGRFVEEKGIIYLLQAMRIVKERMPEAKLLLAGDYEGVAGGSIIDELTPLLSELGESVKLLGRLPHEDIPGFLSSLHVFTLPSVNSFESFGMVQVEAMLRGTPVVASELPGVRTVIQRTGMGLLVPPRDAERLAEALMHVMQNGMEFRSHFAKAVGGYSLNSALQAYLNLFCHPVKEGNLAPTR